MSSSELIELEIDRSKWQRVSQEVRDDILNNPFCEINNSLPVWTASLLRHRSNDRMCCLGFCCLKLGVDKKSIIDIASPSGLKISDREKISVLFSNFKDRILNDETKNLMGINDSIMTSDLEKEREIKKEFMKLKINVTFVGPTIEEEIAQAKQRLKGKTNE